MLQTNHFLPQKNDRIDLKQIKSPQIDKILSMHSFQGKKPKKIRYIKNPDFNKMVKKEVDQAVVLDELEFQ